MWYKGLIKASLAEGRRGVMERQIESLLRGGQFKQLLENYIRNLRDKYDLKRTEIEVLYYLSRSGGKNSAKDIAAALHMNKGHLSQTTESLCEKGLITAARDENDYRVVHFSITAGAQAVAGEIDTAIDRLYAELFRDVSADDLETLKRIADRMSENVDRLLREI